jgi:hypothetical protein
MSRMGFVLCQCPGLGESGSGSVGGRHRHREADKTAGRAGRGWGGPLVLLLVC